MRRPALSLRHSSLLSPLLVASAIAAAGCYSAGEGQTPPEDRIYFPVGLALANDSKHLLVANSDFDLQYNAGTLNVLDVGALHPLLTVPCGNNDDCAAASARCRAESPEGSDCDSRPVCDVTLGLCKQTPADDSASPVVCGSSLRQRELKEQLLSPGACDYIDPARLPNGGTLLRSEVQIGSFATDVVYRERPPSSDPSTFAGRAFLPVRGDATLHWIDVSPDGSLECGQGSGKVCDDLHRAGNHEEENTRNLRLAPEPFALDASPDGEAVLVTNQTTGTVSLFVNDWNSPNGAALQFAVTGLPLRPMGIAALPVPAYASALGSYYPPGFLVTFRNAAEVDLLRYYDDQNTALMQGGTPVARPYAARTAVSGIRINSVGTDSRGIAVDGVARAEAELACFSAIGLDPSCIASNTCLEAIPEAQRQAFRNCLNTASATPLDVFVANHAPATLLLGRTTPVQNALESTELPNFYDSLPLTLGPSRVVIGKVIVGVDEQGKNVLERRVFVVCFDSRRIFVYDPHARRMDAEIVTGRGPHALAVDEKHGWLFVGHFTDSFIGVVSLDRRFPKTYGTTLAIIGEPTPPRASK
ncbi:MAG TPA: hypothetical protein VFQ35_11970 [Polyangiaceae bacterium]|nr:hypothetical protein [Polyangiaceae bacterium]